MVSWYTSSHLTRLVDPSYFSIPNSLKFRDQQTLHKFTFERGFDGELVHLEPLGWVGGPIVLLNPQRLEVQGSTDPLQVMRERLDCVFHLENGDGGVGRSKDDSRNNPSPHIV
jgi:hypothetical protein